MATIDSSFIVHGPRSVVPPITESLGEFYHARLLEHGDHVSMVIEIDGVETVITFAETLGQAQSVSHLLRRHGLHVGDTVMLCCGNSTDYAPVMLGTLFVGAALAPVNPALDEGDLLHLLAVIQPQLVITNAEAEAAITAALERYTARVPLVNLATLHEAFTLVTDPKDFQVAKIDADLASHVAFVMCSSGTSGKPKGVEMTHASILSQLYGLRYIRLNGTDVAQTVAINISGPYWITCMFITLFSLHLGYKLVLLPEFDARLYLETIQKHRVNFTLSSPAIIYAINKLADADRYDVTSLKVFTCGGGPTSVAALEQVKQKLNVMIALSYAMTEAPSIVQVALGPLNRPASVGYPFPNVDAKVVDVDTGTPLGPKQSGELCFKAATLMKGYRGNPEATRAAFDADGFFHTGDIGHYDEDGYIYIVDRIKELIKNKGHHVPAVDIEEVLMEHEEVAEAAVVGIEHETDWEHATAFVVKTPQSRVSEEDLVSLVKEKLSSLKWLYGGVRFIPSMPKTATGKIRKRDLRNSVKVL